MAARLEESPAGNIEALYRPTHDERARQRAVSMLRKHAIIDLREAMRADYEARVAPALGGQGQPRGGWKAIEAAMCPRPSYRFYSTVRYNAQEMCYLAVQPAIERALPAMIDVARDLARRCPAGGSLTLDPGLAMPRYSQALDVHLTPGWVYREYVPDDVAQGAVVSFGGKVFTGQHPYRRNRGAVAESIGYWVRQRFPSLRPRRLLDIGTTSGGNLFPHVATFPEAEAHGIDISAPVLRFGHAIAQHAGLPVHFSQQNAERTSFPDGHFDLIVSSFFFHEIPLRSTRAVLRECHRLLAPGGVMVHMELPDEASMSDYGNFFWNWDTRNNNEPWYTAYREQDPLALCAGAGFGAADCFKLLIPDLQSFGADRYARFMRGEIAAPPHGGGGWFVFGAQKR
ncbi:MAG: methyltransferase domain-containing protein [Chromatiales bacterium]|jgi:SAM-dependent methyltransferase|nr:methyltransferase domain-containing protein [Chromatiales bacterium]